MPNVRATKALQKRSDQALDAFHKYYASIWGEERWEHSLLPALSDPTRYCALMNCYADNPDPKALLRKDENQNDEIFNIELPATSSKVPLAFARTSDSNFPPPFSSPSPEPGASLLSHWNMDAASVIAACMLGVVPGDKVLDLCAAPGGKSIVLAQILWPKLHAGKPLVDELEIDQTPSILHSNEFDKTRHTRLDSNLKSYLPQILLTDNLVKVLRIDGSDKTAVADLPFGESGYDKVLLDAPCSSERHIIHAYLKAKSSGQIAEEMSNWKSSHTKTLAKTQVALLMTAVKAVNIGGSVLYATCSISQEENDDVIDRMLDAVKRERKRATNLQSQWRIKIEDICNEDTQVKALLDMITESTKHGRIALPDHQAGGRWGPLYFALLKKVPQRVRTISKDNLDSI